MDGNLLKRFEFRGLEHRKGALNPCGSVQKHKSMRMNFGGKGFKTPRETHIGKIKGSKTGWAALPRSRYAHFAGSPHTPM